MRYQNLYRNVSWIYLIIVPLVTAVLGFTVKSISYQVYLPLWILNVFLMLAACRMLSVRNALLGNREKKRMAAGGLLLIAPWMFYSIFAAMGSPPETYAEWVGNAFEQQVRYSFLIIGGILLLLGFAVVRESIKHTNGNIFSLIGFTAICIAMILFILNMCYWNSFVPESFKTEEALTLNKLPEWYQPVKKLFLVIAIVEVSLTYVATAAFAAALKSAGWFKKAASWVYIAIGLFAFAAVALYGYYSETIVKNGFPFYSLMIPAIPFAMPYYGREFVTAFRKLNRKFRYCYKDQTNE